VDEDSPFTVMVEEENPKMDPSRKIVYLPHVQSISNESADIAKAMAVSNLINHDPPLTMEESHIVKPTKIDFRHPNTFLSTIPIVTVIEESAGNVGVGDIDASQAPVATFGGAKVDAPDMMINDLALPGCNTTDRYSIQTVISDKSGGNVANMVTQEDDDGTFLTRSTSYDARVSCIFDCIEVRSDFENVSRSCKSFANASV